MAVTNASDDQHFSRFVKRANALTDGDGNYLGVTYAAFELREARDEKYLSANCLELVDADRAVALSAIKKIIEKKFDRLKVGLLTVGKVRNIRAAFLPHKIRATLEPKIPYDPSYAAVRQLPLERRIALEKLASSAWNEWVSITDI
tara:strand:+ start:789 stop:1226 length:438 start_codon:yes stop_codon:yes gene_type:complete